jgi:hypothetical protein
MKSRIVIFMNILAMAAMLIFTGASNSVAQTRDEVLRRVPVEWSADVGRILTLAEGEWNDGELMDALTTYPVGSSKHRAVCFLIANMDKNLYVEYVNPDDPLNPISPEDWEGEWLREYIYDYSTMSAELLIENVEWAYLARETFPWCSSLSEDVFFRYVLPYRSTQEPIHSWRQMLYGELSPMVTGLNNALEVAETINRYNTSIFHFDSLYYRHPEDADIPTLLSVGAGRCEDMSNLSNYSLRALGVPTTSDFTPWWPKGDNNHAWNVVYNQGTWYSFMGCEAGTEPVYNTIKNSDFAKVYRECFSADPIMQAAPDGTEPPRLMRIAAYDVTSEYSTVSNVRIDVNNPSLATYLCVFNFNTWQAVAGVWAENGRVNFPNVGNHDILYCATKYVENESGWGDHFPVAPPFILHRDGSIEWINCCPESEPTGDIILSGWCNGAVLTADQEVTLFTYVGVEPVNGEMPDNPMTWKIVGNVQTTDVDGVVSAEFISAGVNGALYLLSDSGNAESFKEGTRPFVWTDGAVIYY